MTLLRKTVPDTLSRLFCWFGERPGVALTLAAVLFLALGYGQDGINLDSTTYSVIARNMAETGRWFNPTYTPFYHPAFAEHPPLVMWMQGIIFLVLGATDSTARIFGAICSLGSVMMVYCIGTEVKGRMFGFLCGLTLLLTYNFMQIGNSTLLDVPMTFFVLSVLLGLIRMMKNQNGWITPILTGVALGCALLTKGVVAAPIMPAMLFTLLFLRRDWLKKVRFWPVLVVPILMVGMYILLDIQFANGRFTGYYFHTQVWQRFQGGGPEIETAWYEFSYRFLKLYLPFVLLLPLGVFQLVKNREQLLYPVIITLGTYILIYSVSAKLYYHYFCPTYALAAPIVVLGAFRSASDKFASRVLTWFLPCWVILAIILASAGLRIHEIRSPEIYSLTKPMLSLLDGHPSRQGLLLLDSRPNWDYISKTSWYWRSDIKHVKDIAEAKRSFEESGSFAYLITGNSADQEELLEILKVKEYARNDRLRIFIPAEGDPANERPIKTQAPARPRL